MLADLHIHTTASDGVFSSGAIVALAKEADLQTIAVTDHDSMDNLTSASACAKDQGICFIPGVEISAGGDQEIHILGYGVSPDSKTLAGFFAVQKQERVHRAQRMMDKLHALGYKFDEEAVFAAAGDSIGRPHIARALVENGYADSVADAFDQILGKGKPGYVARAPISPASVIAMLRSAGAVPVLAHPAQLKWPGEHLLPILRDWISHGLMGIEVYHPSQRDDLLHWRTLAVNHQLLITGGSDFHAPGARNGPLGGMAGAWFSAHEDIPRLLEAITRS